MGESRKSGEHPSAAGFGAAAAAAALPCDPQLDPLPLDQHLPVEAREAAASILRHCPVPPAAGLVLGTGLGGLADRIADAVEIPFDRIPCFPRATAFGHRGRVLCGRVAGVPVIALDGRCHLYEGYTPGQITLPVMAMAAAGVRQLILSNASGGLNPIYGPGDVMVIDDHIDLMFRKHPLVVEGLSSPRRRGGEIYCRALRDAAMAAGLKRGFLVHRGVYVAVQGPNYETRAEYRFLRRIGGDAVGMSTVPEAVAGARCGLAVLALSVVTNAARPDAPQVNRAEEIVAAAQRAAARVRSIVEDILADSLASQSRVGRLDALG